MNLTLFADQILTERDRKTLAIIEAIRKGGAISRVQISKVTEQNLVTVSKYVSDLVNRGIVVEKGLDVSTGGRRPALVDLNAGACCAIGITAQPDRTLGVLLNLKAQVVARSRKPGVTVSGEKDLEAILPMVDDLIGQARVDREAVRGIGLSLPQVMTAGRRLAYHDLITRLTQKPVLVERDLVLAALAEQWLSTDRMFKNVLYLHGTKGGCLVVNGRIYRGTGQLAGNLVLFRGDDVQRVERLLTAPHPGADEVRWLAMTLGDTLAPLVNLLAPEAVVLGGGFDRLGASLLDQSAEAVKRGAIEEIGTQVSLVPARLGEEAPAIGAAGAMLTEAFLTRG